MCQQYTSESAWLSQQRSIFDNSVTYCQWFITSREHIVNTGSHHYHNDIAGVCIYNSNNTSKFPLQLTFQTALCIILITIVVTTLITYPLKYIISQLCMPSDYSATDAKKRYISPQLVLAAAN